MKNKFQNILELAISNLGFSKNKIIIQVPKNPDHGDFTTNYPMINCKEIGKAPLEIAEMIVEEIKNISNPIIEEINFVSPGFINAKINKNILSNELQNIITLDYNYGKNDKGEGKKVLVEFVSANPTGPLTVGHGRNAILGATVSNILNWNGSYPSFADQSTILHNLSCTSLSAS